jgi:polysaccharide export outer membrane protein
MGLGQGANMAQAANAGNLIGYLVNESGEIEFPKLGILNVLGYTQQRLRDTIQERLKPYLKEPIVTVTLMNFRVTYITATEANTTLINNNKTSILQFIGTVGGINWLDKRDNIVVIRTVNDVRQTFRVNLTDASVFKSPAFFLQPNDIIYVEPNSRKFLETNVQLLSYVTVITSTLSIFILFINSITN